ncbi:hypothetical protein [Arsenophonus apicola]|uniref:Uncharacterized protein n=1 Tax=Arsenophonus apicola TaxID=2879119 RepID=A0ABY8P1I5_9GAMM|nr:hypothetical protein [Arsenophonus apicola]WGO83062.1 hypothetical protein QG404_12030 [Arsenophonus apicola]
MLEATGVFDDVMITGNTLLCPVERNGILIGGSGEGSVNALYLNGNTIPLSTVKIIVPPSTTGWNSLTRNTRYDIPQAYEGMQLFELSSNKIIQYLNESWRDY